MTSEKRKSNKENTSRLYSRYAWLIDVIYRSNGITFERINELWSNSLLNESGDDLPIKTFHNHRKACEQMFDINIECDRKAGYIYYIENYDDVKQESVGQWLLSTISLNNTINEKYKLKHRILLENIPSGIHFLTTVIEAMNSGCTLEITYQSFGRDKSSIFEIEPYCTKVFKQRWYMLARNTIYGDLRIYALDRIVNIEMKNNKFDMPKDFNAEDYFHDSFGIIVDEDVPIENIVIKALGNKIKYFRTLPLHHSQNENESNDSYSIFNYTLRPTFDFIQELLSHGDEIEVVSPKWLRLEMKDIAKSMTAAHRKSIK